VINPGNLWALIRLGNLHMMTRQPEKALEYFEKALALDPKNKNARQALVAALKSRGQEARRFDVLKELYAEDPAFGSVYAELGEFYRVHGFYRKAELHYRAHLRRYPVAAGAHFLLGGLLVDLKRPREAIKSLERANELGLTSGDLYYRLSQAHFQLKHLDRAYQMAKIAKKNGYPVSVRWIRSLEAALRVYPRTSK
jgi:tetratricopeptide (TPR) repeat protein